ncbi:MAG: cytochrome c3 family protein [Smithellaceae bacterium]|nr:cytochrome c3 family protein [Smithellaceae bacterium]
MTWKRCGTFWTALLFSAASLFFLSLAGSLEGVHRFDGKCSQCHLNQPKKGEKLLFVREIDKLCLECHKQVGAVLSHPSGLKPSFPLPAEFPLDWSGKMTCVTCHEVHGKRKNLLVSEKTGKAFCITCHRGALLTKQGHEAVSSLVHQPQYEITKFDRPLDRESQDCLSCHDGGFARLREVTIGAGIWNHGRGAGVSHPVGVDYQQASRKGGYKRMTSLNRRIRFFNGKLGCGSCHSLYSALPAKLVMSNQGSALCLECHIK